jgi:hypothetical protein
MAFYYETNFRKIRCNIEHGVTGKALFTPGWKVPGRYLWGECGSLIDPGVNLSFEFGEKPLVFPGFYLIKLTFVPVVNIHKKDVVRPADGKGRSELGRHCLPNWCTPSVFSPLEPVPGFPGQFEMIFR